MPIIIIIGDILASTATKKEKAQRKLICEFLRGKSDESMSGIRTPSMRDLMAKVVPMPKELI